MAQRRRSRSRSSSSERRRLPTDLPDALPVLTCRDSYADVQPVYRAATFALLGSSSRAAAAAAAVGTGAVRLVFDGVADTRYRLEDQAAWLAKLRPSPLDPVRFLALDDHLYWRFGSLGLLQHLMADLLASLPNLSHLALHQRQVIAPADVARLTQLSSLLLCPYAKVADARQAVQHVTSHLTQLVALSLPGSIDPDVWSVLADGLPRLSHLHTLVLARHRVRPSAADVVGVCRVLPSLPQLCDVDLSGVFMSRAVMRAVFAVPLPARLRRLTLVLQPMLPDPDCELRQACAAWLCAATRLDALVLAGSRLEPRVMQDLVLTHVLPRLAPRLRRVNLANCNLATGHLPAISTLLRAAPLVHLVLSDNSFDGRPQQVWTQLCQAIVACRTLRSLALASNLVPQHGWDGLVTALHSSASALQTLRLLDLAVGGPLSWHDTGAPSLLGVAALRHLAYLDLSNLMMNVRGTEMPPLLTALRDMPHLRVLLLIHTRLRQQAVQQFASAVLPSLTRLQHLSLSRNELSSHSAASVLASLADLPAIQRFDMVQTARVVLPSWVVDLPLYIDCSFATNWPDLFHNMGPFPQLAEPSKAPPPQPPTLYEVAANAVLTRQARRAVLSSGLPGDLHPRSLRTRMYMCLLCHRWRMRRGVRFLGIRDLNIASHGTMGSTFLLDSFACPECYQFRWVSGPGRHVPSAWIPVYLLQELFGSSSPEHWGVYS